MTGFRDRRHSSRSLRVNEISLSTKGLWSQPRLRCTPRPVGRSGLRPPHDVSADQAIPHHVARLIVYAFHQNRLRSGTCRSG